MSRLGSISNTNEDVVAELKKYGTNDRVEVSSTVSYIGSEKDDGTWLFKKIDSSGTYKPSIRYARQLNNPTVTSYADALANYDTLTYGTYSQAF